MLKAIERLTRQIGGISEVGLSLLGCVTVSQLKILRCVGSMHVFVIRQVVATSLIRLKYWKTKPGESGHVRSFPTTFQLIVLFSAGTSPQRGCSRSIQNRVSAFGHYGSTLGSHIYRYFFIHIEPLSYHNLQLDIFNTKFCFTS